MNDPHVVSLTYRIPEQIGRRYVDPPVVEVETEAYALHLASGVLTVRMKEHHATVESARRRVEPDLVAWEISAGLRYGAHALKFEFVPPGEVIDRNPSPRDDGVITATANLVTGAARLSATATVSQRCYPGLPRGFAATPDVQTMWMRYVMYRDGREPLLSMANACLTLLEGSTGATKNVRQALYDTYAIDRAVRDALGDIVSERGDATQARKLGSRATMTPLTDNEIRWVEEVVQALIRRKAEYDADPAAPLRAIMITDFAPL